MPSDGRKPAGLAVQIVRGTLLIGVATVVLAIVVAVLGTSHLVSDSIAAQDMLTLQAIEDTLLSQIAIVDQVAAGASRAVLANRDRRTLSAELRSAETTLPEAIRLVTVVDSGFGSLGSNPATPTALPAQARHAVSSSLAGEAGVTHSPSRTGAGYFWIARAVSAQDGESLVILVELDVSFLDNLLRQGAKNGNSLFLLQGLKPVLKVGTADIDFPSALWTTTGMGSGEITFKNADGRRYVGHFDSIEGVTGVDWRIITIEPRSLIPQDTLIALWPTMLVLAFGGLTALAMAWIAANRVVEPLHTLENAALRAAKGAYIKPIESKREDELGQVARAFNAVALRLNALHDMSQLLASSSQLDQVLDRILAAMGHIVGPGVAAVYLLDEGGRWLVPARARGADIDLAPAIDSLSDMWLARTLDGLDPVQFVPAGRPLSEELPGLAVDETGAVAAPLVAGKETLGVVVVLNDPQTEITEAELEMVRTFSAQAAVAVNNSRLFAVETESRRVAEGLRTVAEQLVRPGGLVDALEDVKASIGALFGAASVWLAVVDRAALGLVPTSEQGVEREMLGFSLRLLNRTRTRGPIVVRPGDDAGADSEMARLGCRELILVPIALESDHGAVLLVALSESRASRRDLELADAVANEIALALDNSYFYEQALMRSASLETVFRISQAVGSSLDVKVVLDRVLDVVQKILSAEAVALMTFDERRREIATEMARGNVSPAMVDRVFRPGDDVVGYVFDSGEPVAFRDLHDGMEGIAGDAAHAGLHSMLAVPLLARGRSIGVLTAYASDEGAFTDDDMSMLQTFASQAALAIDTARLYSQEHEVASVLQRSILPGALPVFPGVESASAYIPAGGKAEIGGDYYDLFVAPDEAMWLAIADVCGKGVNAATKTSMIKYSVRSLVAARFSPGRVVTEVNRMVAEGGNPSDIVTVWVGRVDHAARVLTWSGGGHPPAMLRRGDGSGVIKLASSGPLLGAVAHVTYLEETVEFGPGDAVVLYTDGVTEARSGNSFFGEDRVEATVGLGGSAQEVVDRLEEAIRRFVEVELRDDVAVLAVRLLDEAVTKDSQT